MEEERMSYLVFYLTAERAARQKYTADWRGKHGEPLTLLDLARSTGMYRAADLEDAMNRLAKQLGYDPRDDLFADVPRNQFRWYRKPESK